MRVITARDAKQSFSRRLREVEAGAEVVIAGNGRERARLGPAVPPTDSAARRRRIAEVVALMDRGLDRGGRRHTRAGTHER